MYAKINESLSIAKIGEVDLELHGPRRSGARVGAGKGGITSTTRRCIRSGAHIASAIRRPAWSGGTCPVDRTTEARTPVPTNSASRPQTHASSIRCVTTAVVDHRRNESRHKVLRADPGSVGNTGAADQDVDGTYQVVGGLHEAIYGRRVGEIQMRGEHRSATGPKTGSKFLANAGPAAAHQHQMPTGSQPGRRRQTDG
jgi:hypothetical protein